ncbi:hypothetical protein EV693_102197 [Nicoletella semolina]|uniref:Uncharacterized protein n=1 Tax=Nicoletella semolina TaxID=271160 RepID=A0A4R2NBP8_9PAST|nr:hypothetical protein EV693_102197 [Nicoletella semolina]
MTSLITSSITLFCILILWIGKKAYINRKLSYVIVFILFGVNLVYSYHFK